MNITQISVTSKKDTGKQILKGALTPAEKKIIIQMLNVNLIEGQVRNKVFYIEKTGNNTANIKIATITKSELTGKKEAVWHKETIKYK